MCLCKNYYRRFFKSLNINISLTNFQYQSSYNTDHYCYIACWLCIYHCWSFCPHVLPAHTAVALCRETRGSFVAFSLSFCIPGTQGCRGVHMSVTCLIRNTDTFKIDRPYRVNHMLLAILCQAQY